MVKSLRWAGSWVQLGLHVHIADHYAHVGIRKMVGYYLSAYVSGIAEYAEFRVVLVQISGVWVDCARNSGSGIPELPKFPFALNGHWPQCGNLHQQKQGSTRPRAEVSHVLSYAGSRMQVWDY